MRCPVCENSRCVLGELQPQLTGYRCEVCEGHWITRKQYDTWLKLSRDTAGDVDAAEVELDVRDVQRAKLCPDCGRILLKYRVGQGLAFCLDHCGACGGVWFDALEWRALQQRGLHDGLHKIFSTAWQNAVRGEAIAERLAQVYANRLGAASYEKAREIRQWLQDHPQKEALLAFLGEEDPFSL